MGFDAISVGVARLNGSDDANTAASAAAAEWQQTHNAQSALQAAEDAVGSEDTILPKTFVIDPDGSVAGKPLREPVVQYGPFVMNSRQEIADTFAEYQRTQFGGWPWKSDDPVHARDQARFARHPDGRLDKP